MDAQAERLTAVALVVLAACTPTEGSRVPGGDPARGEEAIRQYACPVCHTIPGITGNTVHVGPPLRDFAERKYIAGVLANTRENLIAWLRDPPAIDPLTAIPKLGVDERDARDIAAFLYRRTR